MPRKWRRSSVVNRPVCIAPRKLKPFNSVIQQCSVCGKIDVYLGDNHSCLDYLAAKENRDMSE